ncbi:MULTISPECIES: thioredoxin family protein [Mameliella]|jgi:thiol-disulfide isomerase/thioredoxin|uniref:thioredoxin family protein n=1 Tax=Mameliella TaxID=1434019 RepID=UPI000B532E13|nr:MULTISPECIES: thioredoxin family protein [Mameliella]MBV6635271.1 thioredoxin family protein [Mameliella sp.]MCR9273872.1 thioredoxin family protein [Paracoccaceae bacterium]MBY6118032.1 thioredoxin family protein [Mameliella alba]OWV42195.1 thiol reductase thioredoxin [Mameliella alba]OWV62117.1 thiol reductase thioredoxin [Mameliella alba]
MDRRRFLTLTAGTALALPLAARAAPLAYKPGLVTTHLDKGETVFLDFKASWCSTCAAQERVINALKSENPDYEAQITFIDVDWDEHGRSELARSLKIPRRSTLVVLKGQAELGRIVAQTSRASIKGLMDTALTAAMA